MTGVGATDAVGSQLALVRRLGFPDRPARGNALGGGHGVLVHALLEKLRQAPEEDEEEQGSRARQEGRERA